VPGGPQDHEHHNLAVMYDGLLLHPWAPEFGGGGVSFFDVSDPCVPRLVGQGYTPKMRETHTLSFGSAGDREYLAVDYLEPDQPAVGGIGFWDITDPSAPVWVSELATPNFHYPDSYLRVTFSTFWLGPVVYVAAGFNGVHVVDATDPTAPVLVKTVTFDEVHLVGRVDVIGSRMFVHGAGTDVLVELDVSDPWDPKPISNGRLQVEGSDGEERPYYFSSIAGRYGLFARSKSAGGPIVYDLSAPGDPVWVSEVVTEGGDGGYVYRQGDRIFQGDSNFGAIHDFSAPASPSELTRITVRGDLDTMSPIGNVVVVSVDQGALPGEASAVFPWDEAPDSTAPVAEMLWPRPGAAGVAPAAAIGVSFDEWIEPKSAHMGSFRVWDVRRREVVRGQVQVQEALVNFTPEAPWEDDTSYAVWLPAGGITDVSGNPLADDVRSVFSTGAVVQVAR
jgi:hypothetical protein